MSTKIRTGQAAPPLERAAFHERFVVHFHDPAFEAEADAIARLEDIAWGAYQEGRKAPFTRPAGPGFGDPSYPTSVEWLETRGRLIAAQQRWREPATPSRVLLICGSARNDGSCPGEVSKTWRLTDLAREVVDGMGVQADVLDLSEEERWRDPALVEVLRLVDERAGFPAPKTPPWLRPRLHGRYAGG